MRFGPKCEDGSLPVFSVDTEEQAKELLSLACETNGAGEYVARELLHRQTLDNLKAFSDRLAATWEWLKTKNGPFPQPPSIFWVMEEHAKANPTPVRRRRKAK